MDEWCFPTFIPAAPNCNPEQADLIRSLVPCLQDERLCRFVEHLARLGPPPRASSKKLGDLIANKGKSGQIVANRNQDLRLFGRWRVPETFGFGPSKFRCWFHFDGFGLFPTLGQMLLVGEKNTQQTWQQDDFFGALLGTCTIAPGVELEAMLKTLPAGWSSVVSTWNHPRILQCGPRQIANLLYDKANVDISRARWFHEPASIWSLGAQPHIFSMFAGDSSCQVWSHLFAGSFRRVFTALRQWPVVPGRAQEISTKTGEVVDLYGSIYLSISGVP